MIAIRKIVKIGAIAGVAVLSVIGSVNARQESVNFSYYEAELTTRASVGRLYERLRDTAHEACRHHASRGLDRRRADACVRTYVSEVIEEIDHTALYAVHKRDTRRWARR